MQEIYQELTRIIYMEYNYMYYNIWNALYFAANFYRTEIISLLLKETLIDVNEQADY